MADLVVSKTGYSAVSEAIRGRVPMFLFMRECYEEDKLIAERAEKLGIGKEIKVEDFANEYWIDGLTDLEKYKDGFDRLDNTFKADGTSDAVDIIREMIL